MTMSFRSSCLLLLQASAYLLSFAAADLHCQDLVLHNWTTPRVRLQVQDFLSTPQYNTTPAYLLAGVPFKMDSLSGNGSVFKVKTCNSTSLGVQTTYSCDYDEEDNLWFQVFTYYIQIINPKTGHCLTQGQTKGRYTSLDFKTCNTKPTDFSQLNTAYVTNQCSQDCCSNVTNVDGYDTWLNINAPEGNSTKYFSGWSLQGDPNHIILSIINHSPVFNNHDHIEKVFGMPSDALRQ